MEANAERWFKEQEVQEPEPYKSGDVVRVLGEVRTRDIEGEQIEIPAGTQCTVIEVAESEFQLEVECVVGNDIVVAVV
ncbi:MAG: hypothetical protein HC888_02065 [Candidatus Competibacteraceae bacterium]|nr:hypothetical protein [Candidatus Competibacteraceae bacterium]